jgi:hypothetical protein
MAPELVPSGEVIAPSVFSVWVTGQCTMAAELPPGSVTVTLNLPLILLFLYFHSPQTHSDNVIVNRSISLA